MENINGIFSGGLDTQITEKEIARGNEWLKIESGKWQETLNNYLLTRTNLEEGCSLTRADAVIYEVVFPTVSEWKAKQQKAFPNVVRWFDLVQHHSQAKQFTSRPLVPISRASPAFLAAPPPQGAAPQQENLAIEPQGAPEKPQEKVAAAAAAKPQEKKEGGKPQQGKEKQEKGGKQQGGKQQQQPKGGKGKGGGAPKAAAAPAGTEFSKLNIVVGEIKSAEKHPDADALYHEQIDLGEESGPRSVVSGLVKHISLDEFVGKKVLVLTNLKPAKMRGILSSGMVLCASLKDGGGLEVLSPPEGAKIGERLMVEGEEGEAVNQLQPKKKVWDKIRDSGDFTVSDAGEVVYKGKPLTSSAGSVISVKKLVGAQIA